MGNILKERDSILNQNVYKINNLKVYQYGNVVKLIYFKKPTRAKGFECEKDKIPAVIPQAESMEQLNEWFEKIVRNIDTDEPIEIIIVSTMEYGLSIQCTLFFLSKI